MGEVCSSTRTVAHGDLRFQSTSYDWLLVNGGGDAQIQFKGSRTLNGTLAPNGAHYRFMVWAEDLPSGDSLGIRIWWEEEATANEYTVYHGGGPLVDGAIIVHTK